MYARSNRQVERTVQTLKQIIKIAKAEEKDIYYALLAYRSTNLYGIGASPAQLLTSRNL